MSKEHNSKVKKKKKAGVKQLQLQRSYKITYSQHNILHETTTNQDLKS